ncbi:hypothetical protein AXF42_Ash018562 [Apostasia shenzhenica]|uniref:Uncharacterized protein n=1 Tax=Apostasia shenzhenica TaxID=1088818 RepID=A0A2I0APV2_9ASPA|nr:hypothetical protein AXF42_Ash018562 [Apostasia shenzhenica]
MVLHGPCMALNAGALWRICKSQTQIWHGYIRGGWLHQIVVIEDAEEMKLRSLYH